VLRKKRKAHQDQIVLYTGGRLIEVSVRFINLSVFRQACIEEILLLVLHDYVYGCMLQWLCLLGLINCCPFFATYMARLWSSSLKKKN